MKDRTPIPSSLCSDVLYKSDRTCCVCNERGKSVQIHHIDSDPSNNNEKNFAVLCLECHNDTQIRGGFGRHLTNDLINKYRDEWLERVYKRRKEVDKRVIEHASPVYRFVKIETLVYSDERSNTILDYIKSLSSFLNALKVEARKGWDTGITLKIVQSSYDYVDSLQGVLVTLASFYPAGNFNRQDPHVFFSEIIASRYLWHRTHIAPYGPGTGGTIAGVMICGSVVDNVEEMVKDMVRSLSGYDGFDFNGWVLLWNQ